MTLAGCLAGCSRNFCSTHRFSSRRVVFAGQNLGVRPKISFSLTTSQKAQINCRCHHFQVKPLPACLTLLLSHYRAQTVRNHDIDDHGPQPKGGYNDIPPIQVRLVLQGNRFNQLTSQPTHHVFCLAHRGRARHVDTLDTVTSLSPLTHCMHFLPIIFIYRDDVSRAAADSFRLQVRFHL